MPQPTPSPSSTLPKLVLFEDEIAQGRTFLPLTYTRPVAALRAGAYTALERCQLLFADHQIILHTRPVLKDVVCERHGLVTNTIPDDEPTLFINARAFLTMQLPKRAAKLQEDESLVDSTGEIIAACTRASAARGMILNGEPLDLKKLALKGEVTDATCFGALWDVIHFNSHAIRHDVELMLEHQRIEGIDPLSMNGVLVASPERVLIHPSAKVGLGTVLDATDGPIVIESGARIMPNSTIMGPVVIGSNALVKVAAKIYEGTTIGPTSKVGGEIENSIVLGLSNKQHDGYLGHSYLGEWCNLGADTNTSDLKNDYSTVKVTIEDQTFDTNSMFVGLLMGDHSKSAINTQFNTGTAVGVSVNVFDAGFPPKWIQSFSWGGAKGFESYRFDKASKVAKIVTERRNVTLSDAEIELLRYLYNRTQQAEA